MFLKRTKVLDSCTFALAPAFEQIPSHPFASLSAPPASRSHSSHVLTFRHFFPPMLPPSFPRSLLFPFRDFYNPSLLDPSSPLPSPIICNVPALIFLPSRLRVTHPLAWFCFHFCLGRQICHLL